MEQVVELIGQKELAPELQEEVELDLVQAFQEYPLVREQLVELMDQIILEVVLVEVEMGELQVMAVQV